MAKDDTVQETKEPVTPPPATPDIEPTDTTIQKPAEKSATEVTIPPGPELKKAPSAPVETKTPVPPETVEKPETEETLAPKKSGGAGKCLLVGCLLLVCCCVTTVAGGFAAYKLGAAAWVSGSKKPDQSLTRITPSEFTALKTDVQGKEAVLSEDGTSATYSLSEKEFAALLVSLLGENMDPSKVGIDFEKDAFEVEFALGAVIKASVPDQQTRDQLSGLDEMLVSFSGEITSGGKAIDITSLSLGNSVIDSIIAGPAASAIEQTVAETVSNTNADKTYSTGDNVNVNMNVKDIKLLKDQIEVTFLQEGTSTP